MNHHKNVILSLRKNYQIYFSCFQMSFAFKKRANLHYNKRGRIAPYTKDGGRRVSEFSQK